MKARPFVSVIVPMRNEEGSVRACLDALMEQTLEPGRFEVLVVDGLSEDDSANVVREFERDRPQVRLVGNPLRVTPAGMNAGFREARGDVLVLVGARTSVAPDFLERNLEALERSGADVVGGIMKAKGRTPFGRVAALALGSRFGVGAIPFRQAQAEGFVDTVAYGAYRREILEKVGLMDEELVRDQDDEMSHRIRKAGGTIFMTPDIVTTYVVRGTPRDLARQYFEYGFWKVRVFQKHPRQMQPRQFVPAGAVATAAGLGMAGFVWSATWIGLAVPTAVYLALLGRAALDIRRREPTASIVHAGCVFPVLHLSYGVGFLLGLVRFAGRWGRSGPEPPSLEPRTSR